MRTSADMLTIIITWEVQIRAETTGDATACEDLPRTPRENISIAYMRIGQGFCE